MLNLPLPSFDGARVLITGGLGFIGSNLAIALVGAGARVTIIDALIPEYGGNFFNIAPVRDQVHVHVGDICDTHAMNWLVRGQDFIFHLAGQVSHVLSLTNPFPDIEYNIKGTAVLMEAVRRHQPQARVIFTGTRGQYGSAVQLPVSEDTPTNPRGIYEISNLTAEKIIQVYHQTHGIWAVLLRLTNTYGPRAQMKHSHYGVVNWFVRQVIDDECIQVFGDGSIQRDFLYIEDCVRALLMAADCDEACGEVLNVGVDRPTTFLELVQTLISVAGQGRWEFAPFSPERRAQEPGHFYSDIRKIRRIVGWEPTWELADGLRETVAYYRTYREHYWTPARPARRRAGRRAVSRPQLTV
ncbi:MAG: GDP-mannose 4,6-dehydratase [Gemmataceae bacterium]|nr:GDP-mannose 4,6-dehydratase [Gemmataceae bacterium]MDW8263753.1 GDP-mannose 4,6-dehydratase [Gemmataceae bacterium]